tara:strand:- start:38827 stop:39210 length:384 start_codon:yes stop_codon:yes gene_type:complete
MKKIKLFIAVFLIGITANAQLTKKIKSHEFESGMKVEIGNEFTFETGSHPTISGEYLWSYQGKKKSPIPVKRFGSYFDGKTFKIERLLILKGLKNKDESVIASFKIGKESYYIFISQSIKSNEITTI